MKNKYKMADKMIFVRDKYVTKSNFPVGSSLSNITLLGKEKIETMRTSGGRRLYNVEKIKKMKGR